MSERPEVSVVIPTRDRWPLLSANALPSALGQRDVVVEVIVVDDISTDATFERLEQVGDPRLHVVRNERAGGVSGARNTGIEAARGRWIAFLDDDDLWSPLKIRAQLDRMGRAKWGFASVIVVDESLAPLYALPLPDPDRVRDALMLGNVVPGGSSNVVAEAELVRSLGGFDEELGHSADWDLWLRLSASGPPAICDEVLVASLEHTARMLFRDRPDVRAESERLFEKHGGASRRQRLAVAEWLAAEYRSVGDYTSAAKVFAVAGFRLRSPGNLAAAVGALFGEKGLRAVSRLLELTRGATHLDRERSPVTDEPAWLRGHRTSTLPGT